jgi:hypothetical protein
MTPNFHPNSTACLLEETKSKIRAHDGMDEATFAAMYDHSVAEYQSYAIFGFLIQMVGVYCIHVS